MLSRRTFVSLAAATAAAPRLAGAQPAVRETAPSAQGAATASFYERAMSGSAIRRPAPASRCWPPLVVV